jgi:hypothetical protein
VSFGLLLTACDSGGNNDRKPKVCFETTLANCGSGPWDPVGIALALAWYSGQCTEEVACAADVTTDIENGIVTGDYIASQWTTSSADETEPNDGITQANPFVIPAKNGLLYDGKLNDTTDIADYLALVFDTSGYTLYVCAAPDDCLQPWLTGNQLHLELYDQNGVLLETTAMTGGEHFISLSASAGVLYYLAVAADNTGAADMQYRLVVTD